MIKLENQVDKAVQEGLGKLRVKAPAGSWKAIERRLDQENKRRGLMIFLPWAASIAVAFLLGMLFYDFPVALYSHQPRVISIDNEEISEMPVEGRIAKDGQVAGKNGNAQGAGQSGERPDARVAGGSDQGAELIAMGKEGLQGAGGQAAGSNRSLENADSPVLQKLLSVSNNSLRVADSHPNLPADQRNAYQPALAEIEEQSSIPMIFEVAGNAAPQYSFRNSSAESTNDFYTQTGGLENQNKEHGILSYAGGVDVAMTRSRWTFSSGVYLSRVGHQIENVTISKVVFPNSQSTSIAATSVGNVLLNQARSPISVDDVNSLNYSPSSDFQSVTTEDIGASLRSSFNFVEIPLSASYRLISKPFEINVLSGVSLAILYKNQVQLNYQNNVSSLVALSNLNTLNYNTMAGLQFAFPISKSLKFHFQPLYRQSLSPLNKDFVVNYYMYSFSLMTGLSYSF